jgi:hypothetical protein
MAQEQLRLRELAAVARRVTADEVGDGRWLKRILLQREVQVSAEVVNPHVIPWHRRGRGCWALPKGARRYAARVWRVNSSGGSRTHGEDSPHGTGIHALTQRLYNVSLQLTGAPSILVERALAIDPSEGFPILG